MENLNLFNSLETTSKDTKKSLDTSKSSDTKKDGISLFDSLLKESNNTIVKSEQSEESGQSNQSAQTKETVKTKEVSPVAQLSVTTQANKNISMGEEDTTKLESQNKEKSLLTSNSNASNSSSTLNSLNTLNMPNISKTAIETKIDTNATTPLENELVKKEQNIQNSSSKAVASNDLTQSSSTLESSTQLSESQKANENIQTIDKNNIVLNSKLQEQTSVNINKTQDVVLKTSSESNDDSNLSLMDKLLLDAKKAIEVSIDNEDTNTKDLKTNIAVKNDSNLDTQVKVNQSNQDLKNKQDVEVKQAIEIKQTEQSKEQTVNIETQKIETKAQNIEVNHDASDKSDKNANSNIVNTKINIQANTSDEKEVLVKNFEVITKDKIVDTNASANLSTDQEQTEAIKSDVPTNSEESLTLNQQEDKNTKQSTQTATQATAQTTTQTVTQNTQVESLVNTTTNLINSKNSVETSTTLQASQIQAQSSQFPNESSDSLETTKNGNLNGLDKSSIVDQKIEVKSSLLDELIKKATATIENKESETTLETKIETKSETKPEITTLSNTLTKEQSSKTEVISSIFLGAQKNSANNQNIINTSTARAILDNASGISDVKKASEVLGLNAQEVDLKVQSNELLNDVDVTKLDRKISILDRVLTNIQRIEDTNVLISKFTELGKMESFTSSMNNTEYLADDVSLNVNLNLANSIQTRIIGARQQMSSMMSDLARTMYENYKPPVTTFKINLNPANLGMISVVMKNERDNSISISMNMSNNATLEAMIDNQNSLRSALLKSFGNEESSFDLNFGSNDNQSNNNNEQFTSNFNGDDSENIETQATSTSTTQEDNLTYL